jgi:hypothetical protein
VHAPGANTSLATYLLPEIAKRAEHLLQLGYPALGWLVALNNLSYTAGGYGNGGAGPPGAMNGMAFARAFSPSPQMVSLSPVSCCVQLVHICVGHAQQHYLKHFTYLVLVMPAGHCSGCPLE